MLNRLLSYFVACAVFSCACIANEKDALTVQVKSIKGQSNFTSSTFVGMVAYKDIYHIVSHVSGLVNKVSVTHGQVVKDKDMLYGIKILEPGFSNVFINNEYGEVRIIQTKIRQGQFVDKNEVLAYAVPQHEYKVVVKMLPNEFAKLRKGNNTITADLFPSSNHSKKVYLSEYNVVRPFDSNPFYMIEFLLNCKQNDCENMELSSAVAKITVREASYESVNIPIGYLQNGMKSIYALNESGVIELSDVQIIKLNDNVATIKLSQGSEVKVVVKSNRIPISGELPKEVEELL